MPPVKT